MLVTGDEPAAPLSHWAAAMARCTESKCIAASITLTAWRPHPRRTTSTMRSVRSVWCTAAATMTAEYRRASYSFSVPGSGASSSCSKSRPSSSSMNKKHASESSGM